MIDVAPADAGGATVLEAEKAAVAGSTGAVGSDGSCDDDVGPHATTSHGATSTAAVHKSTRGNEDQRYTASTIGRKRPRNSDRT